MSIIIDEDGLYCEEITKRNSKVRAFLFDENNNVLVANYGDVFLLPGGSVDKTESLEEALVRELGEELGVSYTLEELSYLNTIEYYQRDYPTREGNLVNRVVTTHYYTGMYKGVNKQSLTEKEKKDNFKLEMIPIDKLEEILKNHQSNNLRNYFFTKELLTILNFYLKNKSDKTFKMTSEN